MDLYLERKEAPITLQEWKDYVHSDSELSLSEQGKGINPLTRAPLSFQIPGRAIWKDTCEIFYEAGRIGSAGSSEGIREKLSAIALVLHASVYDCGEEI